MEPIYQDGMIHPALHHTTLSLVFTCTLPGLHLPRKANYKIKKRMMQQKLTLTQYLTSIFKLYIAPQKLKAYSISTSILETIFNV